MKQQVYAPTLQDSAEILSAITDVAKNAMFMLDSHGKIAYCNRAAETMFGWTTAEMLGEDLHRLLVPEQYHAAYHEKFQQFRVSGEGPAVGNTLELTAQRRDGTTFPVEISLSAIRHNSEWNAVGIVRELTECKHSENARRESEEKYRQIVDNVGIGIALISPTLEILDLNRQMRDWFPWIRLKDRPRCFYSFNGKQKPEPCSGCPVCKTLIDGQVHEMNRSVNTADSPRFYRIISSPIHDNEGKVVAAVEIVEDTTERLRLEHELHQAQKLESVGRLAAGIAHEINTPIQYVGDNVEFLREACNSFFDIARSLRAVIAGTASPDAAMIERMQGILDDSNLAYFEDQVPKAIEQSLEGIGRVSTIVQAMKEFSHPGGSEKTYIDLNRCIESTITVSRNEWKYVADVEKNLDPKLPPVLCLPGELNQVFLNIIVNAAHAITDVLGETFSEKGKITVMTFQDGDRAVVLIRDTGTGIPDSIKDHIFDPFFTTKGVGKGTGQGLAIARNVVVEKHGGTIVVDSEHGKGSTFIIRIPIGAAG